jgi:hypothetical protein
MPLPTPSGVWALFMSDAPDFILMFGIVAGAVFWFAWWLRSYIGRERIAALEERLRLAADEQKPLTRQIDTLTMQIGDLTNQITQSATLPQIAVTTAVVTGTVKELTHANTVLGDTLGPSPGTPRYLYEKAAEEWKKRSTSTKNN